MALKIVRAEDPVLIERLNLCIYAPPGVGKTSLGFTAEAPLNLDFDGAVYRAANRKDSVPVTSWSDIDKMEVSDFAPYKTIIVDTAGRALDKLSLDITAKNQKMGTGTDLTQKGWGELKRRFASWIKLINSSGKDVVLICHMEEKQEGDIIRERLDAQGSSKNEIYKTADAMGRIFIREEMKDGKRTIRRYLDFSPREGSFGKNPARLAEIEFPDPLIVPDCLAQIIRTIKAKINQLSEEQQEMLQEVQKWMTAIDECGRLEEFNDMLPRVTEAPAGAKAYFNKCAQAKGFVYNPTSKLYEPAKQETKQAKQPGNKKTTQEPLYA